MELQVALTNSLSPLQAEPKGAVVEISDMQVGSRVPASGGSLVGTCCGSLHRLQRSRYFGGAWREGNDV